MAGRGGVRVAVLIGVALALAAGSAEAAQADTVHVARADYFTNYAGSFVSVEAVAESASRTLTARVGGQSVLLNPFSDAGTYLEHRALVPVASRPDEVKVSSSDGGTDTLAVSDWASGPVLSKPNGYTQDFNTDYVDPQEAFARVRGLAAKFPGLADVVNLPEKTAGYQRHAQAVVGIDPPYAGGKGSLAAPDASSAVVVTSRAWGQDGANDVTIALVDPGAPNAPNGVTVNGNDIGVRLATDALGTVRSTAADVVAALHGSPAAMALVDATTYRGNAGAALVTPTARTRLSDFLDAPASLPRGPQTVQMLRIGAHRDGSKPAVLLFGGVHGDEWVSPLAVLETAGRLLENYGSDQHTKELLDNLEIFIVPVVNPDGAAYSRYDSFAAGAKNLTTYCASSGASDPLARDTWGVDLAGNFRVGSRFDGYAGASAVCTDPAFAGPFESSEPESRNLQQIASTYPNVKFAMDVRSAGGWLTWSPGAYQSVTRMPLPLAPAEMEAWYRSTAQAIADGYKSTRRSVILPQRTGAATDVRASEAGNPIDELFYDLGILGFQLALGPDRFTGTGTQQTPVSKQPPYSSPTAEGHDEAMEGADGISGLLDAALDYAKDVQAPVVHATPAAAPSQTPVALSFTSSEPAAVHYTLDGSSPTAISPVWRPSGRSSTATPLLLDHSTTVKWMALDIKGNQSAVSSARYVVDDVTPETTADVAPAPVGGWYRDPTVTLHATDDEAGVDVSEYRLDGGAWETYSDPIPVTGDGDHTVAYRSRDAAGNIESDHSVTLRVDTTAPTTTAVVSPASNGGWSHAPVVTLHATDAGAGVDVSEYRLDGGAWETYSDPIPVTGDGDHTVAYRSRDAAGNIEADRSVPIRLDTAAPATTAHVDSTPVAGWAPDATVTLRATDPDAGVATTEYRIDGGDWRLYGGPVRVTDDGVHTVGYRSTDAAGNVEPAQTLTLALDGAPPTTTARIFAAEHGGWYRRAIVVLGTSDRGSGPGGTEYRLDGGPWTPYIDAILVTGDGGHTVEYRSRDAIGHVEDPRSLALSVDATDPAIRLDVPAVARFARGATARARYTCTDAGSGVGACSGTQASGARLYTSTPGRHVLTVTARDIAGNVHRQRWTYTVVGRAPKLRIDRRDRHALRDGLRIALTGALRGTVRVTGVLAPRHGGPRVHLRAARVALEPGKATLVTLRLPRGAAKELRGHALVASLRVASRSAALHRTQAKRLTVRP